MSGFGGGFGAPAPGFGQQPTNFFGAAQPQQPAAAPAVAGFGAPGFGGTPVAPPSFGSPQPPPAFGTSTNVTPPAQQMTFGASNNPFGTPPPSAGAPPAVFGTSSTPAPAFGQPLAAAAATTFGQAPAFGQSNAPPNPFGQAPAPAAPAFGTNNPFGGQQPHPQPSNPMNPFGSPTTTQAPAPMMSFGVSSNVAAQGSSSDVAMGSSGGFGSSGGGFGTTSMNDNSMSDQHNASASGLFSPGLPTPDMGDKKPPPSRNNLPFGTPVANNTASTWPTNPFAPSDRDTSAMSPTMTDAASSPTPAGDNDDNDDEDDEAKDNAKDKLAKLKAKLAQKKQLLKEKKQAAAAAASSSPPRDSNARSLSPAPDLAERNAVRFAAGAASQATRAHLPADLQQDTSTDYAALRQTTTHVQELDTATSLVGTCPYMCPDEELLRREREGDIQLLELVRPGELHPSDWTLRNTTVKRFRRSAADYKLDVPEWVRPPSQLERVCSYLEEWVMERDRQGPDPRFGASTTPNSLDVYQFIWDRTRMVRKDFILQNYVGTGGKCDAKAVRCHERIARWHAMCEHQLSHIDDFCTMQSQQNITELGQTMKTLNQYYDDALQRSTVEEPDEQGKETYDANKNQNKTVHGVEANVVQDKPPTDFDGTPLKNVEDGLAQRAIGKPHQHGTAEPEMSGLYILLTIDNDGGMEVMRYVAHLSRVRPHIYRSRPVQLALAIYKAKKESNYSRFFSILRAPSTPYLFACIMFKHVAQMRKVAFHIMSKTFGGKSKDTNEAIYDAYPLKDMVQLLCFEDDEEAKQACQHFNITVKPGKVRGGAEEDHVFWRRSPFSEPKDEDKGTVLALRPRKMNKTIESKLEGATRLAVCRGEKSGDGSFSGEAAVSVPIIPSARDLEQEQKLEELRREQQAQQEAEEKARLEREAREKKQREEAEAKQRAVALEKERQRQEQLQKEQEAKEREARRIAAEQEAARKRAEEEERLRRQRIEEQKRREAELAEKRRKEEEERQRKERERLEKERLEREEAERQEQERQRKIQEEKRRMEEAKQAEIRRRELERLELERKLQREREQKEAAMWKQRVNDARAKLSYRRWLAKFPTHLRLLDETRADLRNLGQSASPTAMRPIPSQVEPTRGLRTFVEAFLRKGLPSAPINAAQVFHHLPASKPPQGVRLYKLAVVFPVVEDQQMLSLLSLIQTWLAKVLEFGKLQTEGSNGCETRVVVVDGNAPNAVDSSDGMLFVIPSIRRTLGAFGPVDLAEALPPLLNNHIPGVALLLVEHLEQDLERLSLELDTRLSSASSKTIAVANSELNEEELCNSLATALSYLAAEVVRTETPKFLERFSIDELCTRCVTNAIWMQEHEKRDDLLVRAKSVLSAMVDEVESLNPHFDESFRWPAAEFGDETNAFVPNYFGDELHLPLRWTDCMERAAMEGQVLPWVDRMEGTLPNVVARLLSGAPEEILEECRIHMDNRSYRRAFQIALEWTSETTKPWQVEYYVYLPGGSLEGLMKRASDKSEPKAESPPQLHDLLQEDGTDSLALLAASPIEATITAVSTATPEREDDTEAVDDDAPPKRPRDGSRLSFGSDDLQSVPPPLDSGSVGKDFSKRRRLSTSSLNQITQHQHRTLYSSELSESQEFTERLNALMNGDILIRNHLVGKTPLSMLLNGAPKPTTELPGGKQ